MSIVRPVGQSMPLPVADAFSLSGKVVIITGAAGNVGSGIVDVFATNKANVVLSDRPGERLDAATAYYEKTYPGLLLIPCDLTIPEQLKALIDQTVAHFGRLDAIVNCGGVPASSAIADEDAPNFDKLYHTNVRSIWLLTKYATAAMSASGGGSIVNISSINGHRAVFMCSLYTGTKAAVLAMTRELAVELAPHKIRVNSVSPGVISDFHKHLDWAVRFLHEPYAAQIKVEFEERTKSDLVGSQPLAMVGHGHDVGMACYYLCSPAARFVTGSDILVDGGKLMEMPDAEPRFFRGQISTWKALRLRLLELPEEAWKQEKPKWLTAIKDKVAATAK